MHTTNGTAGKPLATLGEIAATGKPPPKFKSWSTALEVCRKAHSWSQKQLLAEALKGENLTVASVKRWELAHETPTLNQCHKLRAAMPELAQYDDLLRLDLRADPKLPKKGPLPLQKPEGWPGPPVKHFGAALKWVRVNRGMTQADLGRHFGVVSAAPWEREGTTMVLEVYNNLCAYFEGLAFAPKPRFSQRYQNQIRAKGYMAAQEMNQEAARARRVVEPEPAPVAAPRPEQAHAPLNTAGANYGVLVAAKMALDSEKRRLETRHMEEMLIMDSKLVDAQKKVDEAQAHMMTTAQVLHGGNS